MITKERPKNLPGFAANAALTKARGSYRSAARRSRASGATPELSCHRLCCPSGDCDTTCCAGSDAHVECDANGKANAKCNDCFLTSACTKARGLEDDCEELTILRQFRDQHLLTTREGRALVAKYYRIAPPICRAIETLPYAADIYDYVYRELVQPTVALVKQHDYATATNLYQQVTLELETRLTPEAGVAA